ADGKRARSVLAGAMCEPETLQPGASCPDDFEAFWNAKRAELDAMPFAPKIEPVPSLTNDKIETWSIQLKNINGTTIQGFFAKPKGPGPFPAVMAVHAAGVYGIGPGTVAAYARHGALAIDINPHNIPNGKPKEFYADLKKGALRGYPHMGRASRETSYFLRMFCSCYRAAQYITSRPEWDGEKLVVWGSSQGGGQAFVTAGLCSKVSAFTANVPALCDHAGLLLKRRSGWPQWVALKDGAPDPDMLTAGKYFDCANFARLTSATALVSCGFIDRTCSPTSVWAAYNVLQGEKGMENMVRTGHGINTNFRRRQRKFILDQLGLK
ncbi:MAG: acetylxylan esterase, partial [Lentisphaeria bacterium]|nr:acetylxylan esterase [Lentisphaeria bacterium]